ncbi:phage tail protein [Vibrio parahaemolyticus]|nr:phage tail protein [Vibrio parahaemolyticus]EHV5554785.1 phage tail protein [Vibrio parahaemolyticus]
MSDVQLHGVRTTESISGTVAVVEQSSSVMSIFGTSELLEPGDFYHYSNGDDLKAAVGDGSIRDAMHRIFGSYVSNNSVVVVPLGKPGDFEEPEYPVHSGVSFSSSTATIYLDEGAQLPVTIWNAPGLETTFTSDDELVATVDADGVVTPVAAGSCVITLEVPFGDTPLSKESMSYTLTIEETRPDESVPNGATLSSSDADGYVGTAGAFGADGSIVTLDNPMGLSVQYECSDESIALIDATTGDVTPLMDGDVTITMTLVGKEIDGVLYDSSVLTYNLSVMTIADPLLAAFIEALPLLRKCYQRLGFSPKLHLAPGILHKPGALGQADAAIKSIRGMWFADPPTNVTTWEEARAFKNQYTSQRIVMGWPRPFVLDETTGAQKADWLAPSLAGLAAMVDKNLTGDALIDTGYWCSPSNYLLPDVISPTIELEYIYNDPDTEVNYLNQNGIVTLVNRGGWRAWGNYSSAWPDTSNALSFIAWRRTMDVIEESIEIVTQQFLDKPMFDSPTNFNSTIAGRVRDTVNDYLASKVGQGLVFYSIEILAADNPLASLQKGVITYRYKGTPPVPMQQVEYQAEVYVEGLESAFNQMLGSTS